MKTLNAGRDEYGESHRNPANKTTHWICVPLIYFSVPGALYALHPWAAWAVLIAALSFYVPLSVSLAAGILVLSIVMLALISPACLTS